MNTPPDLVEALKNGNRRALARTITLVENHHPSSSELLALLFPYTGNSWVIGVTGAPGTGKSSLVSSLAQIFRQHEKKVAIIAVDPSSPFTGGAILGDRIRMLDLEADEGVFVRSMATRGSLGAIATTTQDVARVFDAAGYDIVIVETVGAGQGEVDIVRLAHTTIVVEAPGLGDDIQAIKAGILEIADILVVNKADLPEANRTTSTLRTMLALAHPTPKQFIAHHGQLMQSTKAEQSSDTEMWIPPVLKTSIVEGIGIAELYDKIDEHRLFVQSDTNHYKQLERQRLRAELYTRLQDQLMKMINQSISSTQVETSLDQIQERKRAPHMVAQDLFHMIQTQVELKGKP